MERSSRRGALALALVVALGCMAGLALAGCTQNKQPYTVQRPSRVSSLPGGGEIPKGALANLPAAIDAVSKQTSDAVLYSVQMQSSRGLDDVVYWVYVFESPSKNAEYWVLATQGRMVEFAGRKATLTKEEMASIPGTSALKVDTPDALKKAMSAATGVAVTKYLIGLETYKSKSDTSTVQPFVWRIHLISGPTSATVDVNATTGEATVVK